MRTVLLMAAVVCALLIAPACSDDAGDSAHDTHADTHDTHDTHDTGSAPATLSWDAAPPATATAGVEFTATFTVETEGEIHVTELRACAGENHQCGQGDMSTYDVSVPAPADGDVYAGAITLPDAGAWTVVAFAHVGADPYTSAHALVTVE